MVMFAEEVSVCLCACAGAVAFKQKLSQIATMYQDAKGGFEPKVRACSCCWGLRLSPYNEQHQWTWQGPQLSRLAPVATVEAAVPQPEWPLEPCVAGCSVGAGVQEYKFQVQVPGKEDNKLLTVGRADLDMSHYVLAEGTPQSEMLPILFKVGMASTGYLKISITAEVVAGGADSDDGMTEVSGMTGMTANLGEDQDLSGERELHAVGEPAVHGAVTQCVHPGCSWPCDTGRALLAVASWLAGSVHEAQALSLHCICQQHVITLQA